MRTLIVVLAATGLLAAPAVRAAEILITSDDVPAGGLVAARVDLTAAARWCKLGPVAAERLYAVNAADGKDVPSQFVADPDFHDTDHVAGTLLARLPAAGPARLILRLRSNDRVELAGAKDAPWDGVVTTSAYTVEHDAHKQGGLPWRVTFRSTGKRLETFRWNNRLHHRDKGSFCVCDDPEGRIERVGRGPVCTVVRVRGRYVQGGKAAAGGAEAVYDWYYFHDRPLAFVVATITQREPVAWHELHALEFNYSGPTLPQWAGGEPLEQGRFDGSLKSHQGATWGVVHDGHSGLGMFACGQALMYDGGQASYLQAHGEAAWLEWSGPRQEFTSWLWIGSDAAPVEVVRGLAKTPPAATRVSATVDEVHAHVEAARQALAAATVARRRQDWWQVQGGRQLEAQGRLEEAVRATAGRKPPGWTVVHAGDLGMILERDGDGIRLLNLHDSGTDTTLSPTRPLPLFAVTFRQAGSERQLTVSAEKGWRDAQVADDPSAPGGVVLRWRKPADARLGDLEVVARVVPDDATAALKWTLAVEKTPVLWGVWRVVFPQVAVADLGPRGAVFFPKGSGVVQRGVWERPFRFTGTYPSGWASMPFMAAYNDDRRTGLYVAAHDPWGSTKDLRVESQPGEGALTLAVDIPAPNMGLAGNGFALSGQAVWQLLRGDWFDAAVAYRDWVRKEAKWYPKLTPEGRGDTPRWMRELSAWALSGGPAGECVPSVQSFTTFLGAPAAVHWYSWHQIPFDNDYPHYFPTKPGFAEGVRALQASGTAVMPYINGRLWDTRDRGKDDFEFTRVALPSVSKDEKGQPYVESYGSKEADGSPVRLGVMCPTTELWRVRVKETVLRLMNECGVKGVYIDQIAAAAPTLCFDRSHGHPLGGGHWWTEGYWRLLGDIRKSMPADRMLTTECNGEPYIHVMDGYLTWHWQYDGQVAAFPAVYGGTIQMFGRAYGGGSTGDVALRMRAGQQLVFGEQIGWIAPGTVVGTANGAFFRDVVRLRRRLAPFFYAGEMARPPRLVGSVAKVRADWQWGGVDWVTTDAVLVGAWHQPAHGRLAVVFVNVSDEPVTVRVDFDARPLGFTGPTVRLTRITPEGTGESLTSAPAILRSVSLAPRSAWAWEVTAP